jgi:hypothetical protein
MRCCEKRRSTFLCMASLGCRHALPWWLERRRASMALAPATWHLRHLTPGSAEPLRLLRVLMVRMEIAHAAVQT